MGYWKRFALAWFGTFLIFTLYTLAANGRPSSTEDLGLMLLVVAGLALATGSVAAALVRKNDAIMVLVSQVLIIAVVGAIWNR
jgi:hypothetical protein